MVPNIHRVHANEFAAGILHNEYLYNFLDNLSTSRTRSLEFMEPPGTREAGEEMGRASVDDVAIAGSNPTQLARLQQGLRSAFYLYLHAQTLPA